MKKQHVDEIFKLVEAADDLLAAAFQQYGEDCEQDNLHEWECYMFLSMGKSHVAKSLELLNKIKEGA
jgi:hypothetical protein